MAPLAIFALLASTQAQTNFGGASAGSPGSQVKPSSDTRFFTGNSGLDGGLVGLGLGALGATVLAPAGLAAFSSVTTDIKAGLEQLQKPKNNF